MKEGIEYLSEACSYCGKGTIVLINSGKNKGMYMCQKCFKLQER